MPLVLGEVVAGGRGSAALGMRVLRNFCRLLLPVTPSVRGSGLPRHPKISTWG